MTSKPQMPNRADTSFINTMYTKLFTYPSRKNFRVIAFLFSSLKIKTAISSELGAAVTAKKLVIIEKGLYRIVRHRPRIACTCVTASVPALSPLLSATADEGVQAGTSDANLLYQTNNFSCHLNPGSLLRSIQTNIIEVHYTRTASQWIVLVT